MKYLKKFETITESKKMQVGDYILIRSTRNPEDLNNFINNNIGQIKKIESKSIRVMYDDIPEKFYKNFHTKDEGDGRLFGKDQIVEFAKTKENLELKIQMKKFNI